MVIVVAAVLKTGLSPTRSMFLTKRILFPIFRSFHAAAASNSTTLATTAFGNRNSNSTRNTVVFRSYSSGFPLLQKEKDTADNATTTTTTTTTKKEEEEQQNQQLEELGMIESTKNQIMNMIVTKSKDLQFYALVAGGTVGAYIISKGLMSFTGFFTHLSPLVVAKYSFYTGFGTASILGSLTLLTADNLYIRADPVFRYTKNIVENDVRVQQALGSDIYPGKLRSYRLDSGSFHLTNTNKKTTTTTTNTNTNTTGTDTDKEKNKDNTTDSDNNNKTSISLLSSFGLQWQPPRIQMIYDVSASTPPFRTGIVTCEAIKQPGFPFPKLKTNLLKVDYETGNEHESDDGSGMTFEGDATIILKGNIEDMKKVSSRSGLSLEGLAGHVHINRGAAATAAVHATAASSAASSSAANQGKK